MKTKVIIVLGLFWGQLCLAQVTDTGNKVGIGTTNPREKLHVNGNLYMNAGEGFKVFGDVNYFGQWLDGIVFQMEDSNSTNGGTDGGFVFRGYTPSDNVFKDWMVIKSGGKIGIGTTNPDEKLAVNGKIHAKEVRVDLTGWSDFVFKNDYQLPTLSEVEQFIKEQGHLKDIPSEKEVVENGIFIGDMNAKLLQKIEELMLYTIEQQKQIKILLQKIEKLENKK